MATNHKLSVKRSPFPVFIHSYFRSGSTYIFKAFRRSDANYTVFYEPLHENILMNKDNPNLLLDLKFNDNKNLRHPVLEAPYWNEVYNAWPAWQSKINAESIYSAYFGTKSIDLGINFWRSLINSTNGKAVFQECRTSGRIKQIRDELGGYHIYLWRNPWDQWWSYRTESYFDTVNQLIIRAKSIPAPLKIMCKALGVGGQCPISLFEAFTFLESQPLNSENSYLVFYMLWCLGLHSGMKQAHLTLNIDRLSSSTDYRQKIFNKLKAAGLSQLRFSDCSIPQAIYGQKDKDFFVPLEEQVHSWLQAGGWGRDEIRNLIDQRREYEPQPIKSRGKDLLSSTIEQSIRSRLLTIRFQNKIQQISTNLNEAEVKTKAAEANTIKANERADLLEDHLLNSLITKINEFNHSSHHWWTVSNELKQLLDDKEFQLRSIYQSKSWKITLPLRVLMRLTKWLLSLPLMSVRSSIFQAKSWVLRTPKVKSTLSSILQKIPIVFLKLKKLDHIYSIKNSSRINNSAKNLSPGARLIYTELMEVIEKNSRENF